MTPKEFTAWRKYMGFNRAEAARKLNVGKNTPSRWENGLTEIPFGVDLLCAAIALKVKPWSEQQAEDTEK